MIRELRWTGFASVDFVRSRAGSFLLLEVNPRLWDRTQVRLRLAWI